MFGTWLKGKKYEYMKKNGKTSDDFAYEIGYSIGHLRGIESNRKNPPLEDGLKSIARVLELTASEYEEMFTLAFMSRIAIERTMMKKIIENFYGAVSQEEFNAAILAFENNEGVIARLYDGMLQETILRRLVKYIDKSRSEKSKEIPLVKLRTPQSIA